MVAHKGVPARGKKKKSSTKSEEDKSIKETIENMDLYTCDVTENNKFFCANGSSFKNVVDLNEGLHSMDEDTFSHHVNEDKNDFASWIYDVIGEVNLANALRDLDNLEDTRREVRVRIELLGDN